MAKAAASQSGSSKSSCSKALLEAARRAGVPPAHGFVASVVCSTIMRPNLWFRIVLAVAASNGLASADGVGRPVSKLDTAAIDRILRAAVEENRVPGVVAMVATSDAVLYHGAFGKRDVSHGVPMTEDTIFRIASMTKPVTSVAAMQLIEQKKITLDEPVGKYLPSLAKPVVLEGFAGGQPKLRPAKVAITPRHLLTHTSGLAYGTWDKTLHDYFVSRGMNPGASPDDQPLVFEPGAKWEYGTSVDKLGKLVEGISGLTLEEYFDRNILQPLGMQDTFFNVPAAKRARYVTTHQRGPDGKLAEQPAQPPSGLTAFNGGGGLSSTAGDYVKFMQMILRGGSLGQARILRPDTLAMMTRNQTGEIRAGLLTSTMPERSNNVDFHPGFSDRFGFGFLVNPVAYEGGRSKGSLAWAGLANTYFWIDPEKKIAAVILMQILPFCDTEAMAVLRQFERAVYATAEPH